MDLPLFVSDLSSAVLSLCDNCGFVAIFFQLYGHRASVGHFLTGIALRMISLSLAVKSDLA